MGLFSSITGALGLDKPFRTGASKAARDAKKTGAVTLEEQQALRDELQGIYQPTMQTGTDAFQSLADFYGGDQQAIINQAISSPFLDQLVQTGEDAIARTSQATGGFRTGTTNENLAKNSQNVLMGLVDQILQGQQGIANAGFGATDAYSSAMQNIIAGQGATRGQIANVDIAKSANKQNMLSGLASGALSAAGSIFASDINLKENIVKTGRKNGFNWYEWEWNDIAKGLGLTGKSEGYIAQEVEKIRPDLVTKQNGYLAVNYGGF